MFSTRVKHMHYSKQETEHFQNDQVTAMIHQGFNSNVLLFPCLSTNKCGYINADAFENVIYYDGFALTAIHPTLEGLD